MTIQEIAQLYSTLSPAKDLLKEIGKRDGRPLFIQGLTGSAAPLLFGKLTEQLPSPSLFILQDADEAGYFYHDLVRLIGEKDALFFPSSYKRALKYGQHDEANEVLRTEVLTRIASRKAQNVSIVTFPEALAELVLPGTKIREHSIPLSVGQAIAVSSLIEQLHEQGFSEVDYVYEPGQFAVRGGLIDVFSYSCEWPFRIDFFGNEIDTIRTFEVRDQLSRDKLDHIEIVSRFSDNATDKVSFISLLPTDTLLFAKDIAYIRSTIDHIWREGFSSQAITERLEEATEMEQQAILEEMQRERQLISGTHFARDIEKYRFIEFGTHPSIPSHTAIKFNTSAQPLFHKNIELLQQVLSDYITNGYHVYILADSTKQHQRLRDIFHSEEYGKKHPVISFEAVNRTLHEGFIDHDLRACFFTDHQIFDRFHKYNLKSETARSGKIALTLKELQEMEPGDFIVHVDFGIGKFGGLVRVPTGNSYQEMIRIIYLRGDIVDVSIHALYKISKYRRSDTDAPPRLSALGTGAWERLKERTKTRIKDIARDLIKLYARRNHDKGFAFSPDSYLQNELEASFLYEDTPDQLRATADVKHDMERERPMDRLICGDVGFGKTEIAIRAAFKAACDSKQVAVLVPTTVLAFQHYQTFCERLTNLPVRVEYLSRARSAKQTRQIIEDLEAGRIDIIIGTHKLISKQVKWHDLGLLIIDEEQKFGVSTKEKLRKLKTNVDTLTMSATPIPRTLQFSLMGARDMSILRTPPPNRYPIYTELNTFGKEVITEAIQFEMSRNGQVFFVSDRINNLQEIALLIKKYIPDCRVAIGHGQMKPDELEEIIMGFIHQDYDVLLSTTIIENGIDIPNANTIIISNAHKFGLSDLHQMRGRVGRSNRKAFCYLLAPPKAALPSDARHRLEALENFSDLGSGFNLAMQDLDIRGAGNLLGAEQSGFMEDLGYETYQKILQQAVTELKNEEFSDLYEEDAKQGKAVTGDDFISDCTVESDLEMYFPDAYVPGSAERLLLYRELDNIKDEAGLDAYRRRLIDRFGEVPHEGEELMQVVMLRKLARHLGCEKITLRQGYMNMQFISNNDSPFYQSTLFDKVLHYATQHFHRCALKEVKGRKLMKVTPVKTVGEAVKIMKEIDNTDL